MIVFRTSRARLQMYVDKHGVLALSSTYSVIPVRDLEKALGACNVLAALRMLSVPRPWSSTVKARCRGGII